jgi:hypothetical protein
MFRMRTQQKHPPTPQPPPSKIFIPFPTTKTQHHDVSCLRLSPTHRSHPCVTNLVHGNTLKHAASHHNPTPITLTPSQHLPRVKFLDPTKKTCFFPLSLPISLSITLHRIFSSNTFCKTRKNHYNLIRRFFSPSYFSHYDFFGQNHQIFSPFFSNFQPITIYHSPIFVPITPVSWLPFQKKKITIRSE